MGVLEAAARLGARVMVDDAAEVAPLAVTLALDQVAHLQRGGARLVELGQYRLEARDPIVLQLRARDARHAPRGQHLDGARGRGRG